MKYLLIISILLVGCAYSVFTDTLSHLKTINVTTFENKTEEFFLEEELLNYLSNAFNGKNIKTVTIDPDCIISGEIVEYNDKIFEYDSNDEIKSYQMMIVFSVKFLDMVKNDELLDDKKMVYKEVYTVNLEDPSIDFNLKSDTDEAKNVVRQKIYNDFFKDIENRSFEAW